MLCDITDNHISKLWKCLYFVLVYNEAKIHLKAIKQKIILMMEKSSFRYESIYWSVFWKCE